MLNEPDRGLRYSQVNAEHRRDCFFRGRMLGGEVFLFCWEMGSGELVAGRFSCVYFRQEVEREGSG